MTCPNCGGTLDAVALPWTPPWVCEVCRLGWWNAEMTTAARSAWRRQYQDFGSATGAVMAAVAEEMA